LPKQGGKALPGLLGVIIGDVFQFPTKLLAKSLGRVRIEALLAMLLVYPFVS